MSLKLEQKACRKRAALMARIIAWLPTRFGKPICLPFMSHKKLGRNNSLGVVAHRYLQHLSPTSAASVRVEADLNKRMANNSYQARFPPRKEFGNEAMCCC